MTFKTNPTIPKYKHILTNSHLYQLTIALHVGENYMCDVYHFNQLFIAIILVVLVSQKLSYIILFVIKKFCQILYVVSSWWIISWWWCNDSCYRPHSFSPNTHFLSCWNSHSWVSFISQTYYLLCLHPISYLSNILSTLNTLPTGCDLIITCDFNTPHWLHHCVVGWHMVPGWRVCQYKVSPYFCCFLCHASLHAMENFCLSMSMPLPGHFR